MTSLHELARSLLAPTRRVARPSDVLWDARETISTAYGPIAVWAKGTGPTVVLAHGWEADHLDMDAFVAPLVARGRRVVTFDLPAHGESSGEIATLPDLATALHGVADFAGGADAIVAHSVGCATTAIALAAGLQARRVAFVAPPLRYEAFVRFYAQQNGVDGDALVGVLAEMGLDVGPLDIRENAAGIDVPLLIVHSRDDRICDVRNAAKIAAVWRGSTVELLDGLRHVRILRDATVVSRVVEFLTD
ncbi:MAG: alpha/beta fold hydrolase [Candidatus Eremiobacteraeota bacterium]|nr:alpha/beta fold hydrolase [Candidatus Eremiobacteraeota bacterium]